MKLWSGDRLTADLVVSLLSGAGQQVWVDQDSREMENTSVTKEATKGIANVFKH